MSGLSARAAAAQAEQLTIDRIYGGGSLTGPTPVRAEDLARRRARHVPARQGRRPEHVRPVGIQRQGRRDAAAGRLASTLAPGGEQLSDAEKARRERARIAGRTASSTTRWAPDGNEAAVSTWRQIIPLRSRGARRQRRCVNSTPAARRSIRRSRRRAATCPTCANRTCG